MKTVSTRSRRGQADSIFRRGRIAVSLGLFAFVLGGLLSQASAQSSGAPESLWTRTQGEDWPTFLGPRQDGRSSETGLVATWPQSGPPIVWHKTVGEGYSMPSVVGGRLFHFDRERNSARLRAFAVETGEELWRSEYESTYEDAFGYSGGPRATPVVDGDFVYSFGVDGVLRCHRIGDGSVVWERDTNDQFGVVANFFGVASTPLIVGDLLIVPIGGSPAGNHDIHDGQVTTNGTGVVAFDKRNGQERYRAIDDLASYASPVLRPIDGRDQVLWFARSGLWVFDPADGNVKASFPWRARKVYSVNAASPVSWGNRIFLTESYELGGVVVEIGDGRPKVVWKDPPRRGQSLASHWGTPILLEGHLYGSSGEKSGSARLVSVERDTGTVNWSVPGLRRSTLLYVDEHFVVLTEYGELLLIEATPEEYREKARVTLRDPDTGDQLLRYPAWSPPLLSRGLLVLRGERRLVVLDLIPQVDG